MTNSVYVSSAFKRDIKPLAKKYFTLKNSVNKLIDDLKLNPHLGDNYGNGIFKVRLSDESKGKGKRGGFRVMYYHLEITEEKTDILLLSIFDKSAVSTITKSMAMKALKLILDEFENQSI